MNKVLMKFTTVVLAIITCLFCVSCKENETDLNNIGVDGRKQYVFDTQQYIVSNGATNYKILLPSDSSESEEYAAEELRRLMYEASSVDLPIVNEMDTDHNANYISLGETTIADESGIDIDKTRLKRNGFRIDTVDGNVLIQAPNATGLIYGVYRFLEHTCGYRYYSDDCMVIEKGDIPLKNFQFEDWPDFEGRDCHEKSTLKDSRHLMRLFLSGSEFTQDVAYLGGVKWWSSLHDQSAALQILDYSIYRQDYPSWFIGGEGGLQRVHVLRRTDDHAGRLGRRCHAHRHLGD